MKTENAVASTQSMNTNQWISFKDRRPTQEDLPAKFGGYSPKGEWVANMQNHMPDLSFGYTHWLEVNLPPPPPRAKTLAEEDADAFDLWARATEEDNVFCESEAWKAGIAYEREQIAKIIESVEWGSELNKILARVKGTGSAS